ncbi:unnamed protein product [Thlaspi arvense]|uniref:Cation/H+ exchanger transmembrane domain-containing protein n=1 Tax=Thlaspi arvense TaxID=13288 RepID=A0AAU9R8H5_THLAR|nr:unnamed protein product [Thlaspi arvense]
MEELPMSPAGHDPQGQVKQQQAAGVGILLQIMMLVLSFVLGHVLRRHRFHYLPEASGSLLIGFSLQPKPFFSNFGAIVTFAIIGTLVASLVTGGLVYLGGSMYLMYKLPFVECLMFGALISATDPVTVLSIFQELGTDVNLYALVFGESVLNDAVSVSLPAACDTRLFLLDGNIIVQNNVLSKQPGLVWGTFSHGGDQGTISETINERLEHLFKYAGLDTEHLQNLECCLFVLFPYFSYMLAEGVGLSGIVSILFTGIVMKRYTFSNLSEASQSFVSAFFHLISSLAETFTFIYMGFDIAMEQHSWSHVGFILFSIVSSFTGPWAVNVFGCAYLVNLARQEHQKIPMKHQKALWYSGLRGAMAFALALQSLHDLPEGHGQIIFTATTTIVVVTVLLIGGSTGKMLEALEVVGDDLDDSMSDGFEENPRYIPPPFSIGASSDEDTSSSGSRFKMKLKEFHKSTTSFTALDKNFLTPFFTTNSGDGEEE